MPLRSPAQCPRTAPRTAALAPLAPHAAAGIWVTDSMLRQAIERYHRRCIAPQCRPVSSHSGPLESRRRLGKRRMTGIMPPPSSAYPPAWHFEVASIPGAWKWEPPTTPAERARRKQDWSPSGLFNRFIGWLEKSDADRPFIQPPPDIDIAQDLLTPGVAQPDSAAPTELPKEIVKLRSCIGLLDQIDNDTLYGLCKNTRRSLRLRVERGDLSVEGLLLALEPFDQEARSRITDPQAANRNAAMIRRTILTAMDAAQRRNPSALLQQLWMTFAAKICATEGGSHDMQLFWRMMCTMPDLLRAQIPSDQICALTRSFVAAQANRHNLFAHWSSRAARFADVLPRLSEAQRENLRSDMSAFLTQQEDMGSQMARRMRFSWLTIRAYDPSTTTAEFIVSHRDLVQVDGARLNSLQLWQLMAGRLNSTGTFEKEHYSKLMDDEYRYIGQRWIALVTAVARSSNADAGLRQLCACLRGMGEMETLTKALLLPPLHSLQIDAVRAVATACDDHRLALRLYEGLEKKPGARERPDMYWDWTAWRPYVERIVKDPQTEPQRIWQLLNLTASKRAAAADDDAAAAAAAAAEDLEAKMALLDQMGRWYMQAAHLNERQVLRRVEKCASTQRALARTVSPRTLASLMEVVTRDLEKGEWGRTTRLEWLVKVVADVQGEKGAEEALKALKGWRWMVDRYKN